MRNETANIFVEMQNLINQLLDNKAISKTIYEQDSDLHMKMLFVQLELKTKMENEGVTWE